MAPMSTCLWFDGNAEDAAKYYESFFKDCKITHIAKTPEATAEVSGNPAGTVLMVSIRILGNEWKLLNGGPHFKLTPAVSFMIHCKDQAEVDYYWDRLEGDGGKPMECGWIEDKFGVAWQVVPDVIEEIMTSGDAEKINKMTAAMLQMVKMDAGALKAAAES